jgi:type I restriction enzyme S subunit
MKKRGSAAALAVNDLHGKFDEMVDAVLGAAPVSPKNTLIKNRASVDTWEVPLQDIYENKDVRLDASHYDQETATALQALRRSKYELKPLSEIADVSLPGQFVRIWAADKDHGVPYVNATDLMSLTGIGKLGDKTRYLSRQTETDIDELIIHAGWILLTCSGTIGRVFYVPDRLDRWVATHDLIRIIPKDPNTVGFIHAYLSSPIAQKQISGHTHGGQIDHVTHHQIGTILVPMVGKEQISIIHKKTMQALKLREQAIDTLTNIASETAGLVEE